MPDDDGKLTKEDQAAALAWLTERFTNQTCWCCGTKGWTLGQHLVKDELAQQTFIGGAFVPYVVVFCNHCSHAVRFNAMAIGVYKPAPLPGAKGAAPNV